MTHNRCTLDDLLAWRGVDPAEVCEECGGSGIKAYGSTATWRGGVGGQRLTADVCDQCWGSGNRFKPWPSHRRLGPRTFESGDIIGRLMSASVASCSCATKTPVVVHHQPDCLYRVLQDAVTEINRLR